VAGLSLSRRWRVVGVADISTQSLSESPAENDDFCQRSMRDTGNLSQVLGYTADEVEGSVLWERGAVNAFERGSVAVQLSRRVDEFGTVGCIDLHGVQLGDDSGDVLHGKARTCEAFGGEGDRAKGDGFPLG
jgi:hypothetical protein